MNRDLNIGTPITIPHLDLRVGQELEKSLLRRMEPRRNER